MTQPRLMVIIASTRPGRAGLPIANWFVEHAKKHGAFDVTVADLKEIALPHLDEPKHPRFGQYEHEHTKRWSALVSAADAFACVTPEYNYGSPPALLNAFDFLFKEWAYKPMGFVSYGGVSGGLRSVQMTKGVVATLKMMPIPEGVAIPFFTKHVTTDGGFAPGELQDKAAAAMLDELRRWTDALAPLRRK